MRSGGGGTCRRPVLRLRHAQQLTRGPALSPNAAARGAGPPPVTGGSRFRAL